jgi:hypothetical protein
MLGLDYSAGYPVPAAIMAAGYRFVARYLDNGLGGGRANLTAAEAAGLHAAGVAVALVWERKIIGQPDRVTLGRPAGVADAQAADAQAKACGLDRLPIYFAIDFDIGDYAPAATSPRAKLGPAADYFDGVASVLAHNRIGVYGGYYAVSRVLDAGLASWAWQTVAWSGGQIDPRIHLYQRAATVNIGGVDCDVDEARQDLFGQYPQEDDVALTNDDIGLLMKYNVLRPGGDPANPANYVNVGQALIAAFDAKAALVTPQIDYAILAADVAARIHLSGTVVAQGDQPPATS